MPSLFFLPSVSCIQTLPFVARFALDEYGAKFALFCQRFDGRPIKRLLFFVEKAEQFGGGLPRHSRENLVRLEHAMQIRSSCCNVQGSKCTRKPGLEPAPRQVDGCGVAGAMTPTPIKSMTVAELSDRLVARGEPAYRANQIAKWIYGNRREHLRTNERSSAVTASGA
jgi:hypothetical protein